MRWMNLEPIIQSEVSQKEKEKYHILMHIYGIQKNGTAEFVDRATVEKQTQRTDLWTWGEGEMYGKSNMEIYITYVKQIASRNLLYVSGNPNRGGEGDGRDVQKGGVYIYLWLIHVEV